jgi:hypothetical protein
MKANSISRQSLAAYTLVEVLVSAGVILVLLALLVSAVLSALTLFAKNYAVNDSHAKARNFAEKIELRVHESVEPPRLLNKAGAPVAGNGPAAGVGLLRYLTDRPCYTSNSINLNTKSVLTADIGSPAGKRRLRRRDFRVRSGDLLIMPQVREKAHDYGANGSVIAEITGVQINPPSGGPDDLVTAELDFANNFGTYFEPTPIGLTVISPDQPFFILSRSAFITVSSNGNHQLRYYPSLITVANDGQAVFDDPTKFKIIAELAPLPSASESLPFQYTDPDRRAVDINARTISRRYDARLKQMSPSFQSFHTAVSYRSAIQKSLQPN